MKSFQNILKFSSIIIGLFLLFIYGTPKKSALRTLNTTTIYVLDTAKSKINWRNYHNGYIKFREGYLETNDKDILDAKFTVDMNKIVDLDIDNKLLNGTLVNVLKSAEFFNSSIFPESKFELHSIQKDSNNGYIMSGDIILFGSGVCYDFTGRIKYQNDSLYFDTDYIHIDRTDWGIFYLSTKNPHPKDEEESYVVGDTIRIDTHVVAYKKVTTEEE